MFDNVLITFQDHARFHYCISAEYMQNFYHNDKNYNDYFTIAGIKATTKLKDILTDILDKKLENDDFGITSSLHQALGITRDVDREIILLKQQIKLAVLRNLFTYLDNNGNKDNNSRLKLREYLDGRGTKTVILDFFIKSMFDGKIRELIKPFCKITLDSTLFKKLRILWALLTIDT